MELIYILYSLYFQISFDFSDVFWLFVFGYNLISFLALSLIIYFCYTEPGFFMLIENEVKNSRIFKYNKTSVIVQFIFEFATIAALVYIGATNVLTVYILNAAVYYYTKFFIFNETND